MSIGQVLVLVVHIGVLSITSAVVRCGQWVPDVVLCVTRTTYIIVLNLEELRNRAEGNCANTYFL